MTFIRLDSSHTGDERWVGAGGDAFAVHVAALVYSDQQLQDGRISSAMAKRVSLAVEPARAAKAIARLVELGFWSVHPEGGYQIEGYDEHAFPADQIKRTRARWAADKNRRRQHDHGDHSLCKDAKFCPAIRQGSTVESAVDSASDAHAYTKPNSTATQPNSTVGRELGNGEGHERPADAALDPDERPVPMPPEIKDFIATKAAEREAKRARRLSPVREVSQ
ncbi:hypothetical protein [Pedococcus sp. 2YAF34]|uniref:hypothetical protein n=1 Tax=Pedococcus sp. 2YAF34 TaxID=3233032 RepID=UPI003F9D4200